MESIIASSNMQFNERDRRWATVQLMLSTNPNYDNRTIARTLKMQIWIATNNGDMPRVMKTKFSAMVMVFSVVSSDGHIMPPHIFEVGLKINTSVPGCSEECGDPLVQSGGQWQTLGVAAGLGAGPQVQRDPGLASEGVLRLFTLLSLAPLLLRHEPAGLLRLVIRWKHHQHDLPQHQSPLDHHHLPSICRAPAGACGKGMLPVLDLYRGGDWGWRWLHWIDVSSLHNQVTWIDFFNKSFKIRL